MATRTDTLQFMGSRPNEEQIAKRAAEFLADTKWHVKRIGGLTVGRTRRGSTYFAVKVQYTDKV